MFQGNKPNSMPQQNYSNDNNIKQDVFGNVIQKSNEELNAKNYLNYRSNNYNRNINKNNNLLINKYKNLEEPFINQNNRSGSKVFKKFRGKFNKF